MLASNHGKRGRDVVLGVVVSNGAVALRLSNVVGKREGRRGWSAHRARWAVVRSWPAQLRQIIPREKRGPRVDEPASRDIDVEDSRGRKSVVQVQCEQLAVVKLRATIEAETGSQGIYGEIREPEICKSSK